MGGIRKQIAKTEPDQAVKGGGKAYGEWGRRKSKQQKGIGRANSISHQKLESSHTLCKNIQVLTPSEVKIYIKTFKASGYCYIQYVRVRSH